MFDGRTQWPRGAAGVYRCPSWAGLEDCGRRAEDSSHYLRSSWATRLRISVEPLHGIDGLGPRAGQGRAVGYGSANLAHHIVAAEWVGHTDGAFGVFAPLAIDDEQVAVLAGWQLEGR